MAKSTAVVKKTAKRVLSAKQKAVQEVLQITWVLKGDLKRAQMLYLRIGGTLADVRDRALFAELGHPSLEDYADKRLMLGKTSLYKYLKVYNWAKVRHPDWLQPKPKGFIPELNDAADLIWIDDELERKDLEPTQRSKLEALQAKGIEGKLRESDLRAFRRRDNSVQGGLKSFLSALRQLRKRGVALARMPEEVVAHLDSAIEILKNDHTLKLVGLDSIRSIEGEWHQIARA